MKHNSALHHHHHHSTPESTTGNIAIAFVLNLSFALVEFAGGIYTQSLAIMSDGLHDFGDALSLGLSYVLQRKSAQGPSEHFSYGLRRLSLLSAFTSGLFISVGAVVIFIEAISRFSEPREPNGAGMLVLALFGILVNGFAAWRLGSGASHNEQVLKWHLIEDVLGWVAVLIGSLFVWTLGWSWLDPLLAMGISVFVLYNVIRGLRQTVGLFLQQNPNPDGLRAFRQQVAELPGVVETHDVHFWSLDGVRHILSLHLVLKDIGQAEGLKEQVRHISRALGDCHVTIEIESTSEHCHNNCEHTHAHGSHS
jgi:cobalt-zinc-cadmium efflux system protein